MGSASLLQTISILRSPHRHCRPRHLHDHLLLQWNPLLRFPQLRFPLAKLRSPTRLRLRCCAPRLPSAANREEKRSPSPLDVALGALMETLAKLKKPAAAIVLLGFLLAACPPAATLAASGGRMGGGTFSSSSSDSHCSSSSWSWPDPPGSSFSHSVPYYVPAPLGGELYVGPAVGIGCAVRSGFFLLTMGLVGVVMLPGLLSDWTDGSVVTASRNTSVIKLQVGLLGTARSFQKDLDRIAEVADTSSSEGLSYILTEATLVYSAIQTFGSLLTHMWM
ncbi:hypothetical protein Cni_G26393 [Canna indica]|uniref:Uncharacterized protein n=1 Tax=Canna indica TaxID=4628 RepID=A0AAQ3KZM9_9LILI|nr:hypothetical protein Cni_G26393 [Canna indica]